MGSKGLGVHRKQVREVYFWVPDEDSACQQVLIHSFIHSVDIY